MRGEFLIDLMAAISLVDRQRRAIGEVTRRCRLKGKNHLFYCRTRPVREGCDANNFPKEEKRNGSQY
jgi:hypothetical protein